MQHEHFSVNFGPILMELKTETRPVSYILLGTK